MDNPPKDQETVEMFRGAFIHFILSFCISEQKKHPKNKSVCFAVAKCLNIKQRSMIYWGETSHNKTCKDNIGQFQSIDSKLKRLYHIVRQEDQ